MLMMLFTTTSLSVCLLVCTKEIHAYDGFSDVNYNVIQSSAEVLDPA